MKYRIKEVNYGKISVFYPQFKSFLFWQHFRDFEPYAEDCHTIKISFASYREAEDYILVYKASKTRSKKTVVKYYEVD